MFEGIAKPVARISRDENVCMYTEYFRLSEPPFSLTPDPRYLFMSERHREGLAHLFYGVQQPGGFVQLTGEVGSGKTTLSRCLVRQLPPETDVALILNPRLTALELLATVCDELRIAYPVDTASIKVLIDALNRHLLEAHARHRRTVLIIDEAQNLQSDVLEQIRLLTNLETSQEKLLQIILIGQPELLSLLKRKGLRQLAQRITARYHLLPLTRSETYSYIQHRLRVAGRRDPVFTASAMLWVYRLSGGVPRLVNIICDRALLGSYALDKRRVTAGIVRRASRETRGVGPWYRNSRIALTAATVVLLALIIAGGLFFYKPSGLSWVRRNVSAMNTVSSTAVTGDKSDGQEAPTTPNPGPLIKRAAADPIISRKENAGLIEVLSGPTKGAPISGFNAVYAKWGIKQSGNQAELGCKAAQAQGYDCLYLLGGWPKLRRYNIPAILEIVLPNGERRRAALVGLGGETATLNIGNREYAFPLSEIDKVWDGSFILIWKPPFAPRQLAPGDRGEDVAWVRHALDTLEKKSANDAVLETSDFYDDALRQRVSAFQRERSLIQDGFVGTETLVRLAVALEGPNAPALSGGAR